MRNKILTALGLTTIAVLTLGGVAIAQDGGVITEPAVGLLASAAGVSVVVTILLNLIRPLIQPAVFDKFAPLTGVLIGILLAVGFAVSNGDTTSGGLIQAALIGLFAGGYSQNINNVLQRATGNLDTTSPGGA